MAQHSSVLEQSKILAGAAAVIAAKMSVKQKVARLLQMAVDVAGGDGGVLRFRDLGPCDCTPQKDHACGASAGIPAACLDEVLRSGRSFAPPGADGQTAADCPSNGFGRVAAYPLGTVGGVRGVLAIHLNGSPAPDQATRLLLDAIICFVLFVVEMRDQPQGSPPTTVPEGSGGAAKQMVGKSRVTKDLAELATRVAGTDATVLISGETGTGKELIARLIHEQSPRKQGPFVALNCAAFPETLVECELFGHEAGAFTDGKTAKAGKFELANGGSIFLDEIGEMTLSTQAKLLRVLDEHQVWRIGGQVPLDVDVRVIAATNRDLPAMVAKGEFREDLFYRLNVVILQVPPLRERPEDIPVLVEEFLRRVNVKRKASVHGLPPGLLEPGVMELLVAHEWPGNARELENFIEGGVAQAVGGVLLVEDVAKRLSVAAIQAGPRRALPAQSAETAPVGPAAAVSPTVPQSVLQLVCERLKKMCFKIAQTAKSLGRTRQWLGKYITKHKLDACLGFVRTRWAATPVSAK